MTVSDVVSGIRGGIAFLTRIPVRTDEDDWDRFRTFPAAFPLIAYLIGAVAAIPFLIGISPTVTAFSYLLVLIALIGIPHFDGVADLGDALAAHGEASRQQALKDTKTGVGAIVAVGVVITGLLFAAIELASFPVSIAVGIVIAAEVGAKLGMATVACLGTASHEGLGSAFTRGTEPALLLGPALASIPAIVLAPVPAGIAAVIAGPLVAVALLRWADRAIGGVNGDIFGATNEFGRVLGLHAGVIVWMLW